MIAVPGRLPGIGLCSIKINVGGWSEPAAMQREQIE
jgi:hypothetical protein